jgi:predicted HicB family RNase H-like nuclease
MKNKLLEYKGYLGEYEVDHEENVLVGKVINISDTISFVGKTPRGLFDEFKKSVDEYIKFCKEQNRSPQKPYSGKILFRTDPTIHQVLSNLASYRHESLNNLINDLLKKSLKKEMENKKVKQLFKGVIEEVL